MKQAWGTLNKDDLGKTISGLRMARYQIGKSSCDMDLPDVIAHADSFRLFTSDLTDLAKEIASGAYYPTNIDIVDLPKDRLTVRPLAQLDIEHRLAYETAVYTISKSVDNQLSKAVHSYRLKPGGLEFRHGSWVNMQRQIYRYNLKRSELFLARTDISSYYEYMDPALLVKELSGLDIPDWITEFLDKFLNGFNEASGAWGIPQGTNASGILANLYLVPLDEEIESAGLKHFRYSDDVYIFGSSWNLLRDLLVQVTRTLRSRRLNLSKAKTKIQPGALAAKDLADVEEKSEIDYELGRDGKRSQSNLREYFDRARSGEPDTRNIKFCLYRMSKIGDRHAVSWVSRNIDILPDMAREALAYLGGFTETDGAIFGRLARSLIDGKLDHYPYAQQHLLVFFINSGFSSSSLTDYTWSLLRNKNVARYVREMAARYLGLNSRSATAASLKRAFQEERDERVQRALLVACYESKQITPGWLDSIYHMHEGRMVGRTIQYLMSEPDEIPKPRSAKGDWENWGY